MTLSIDSSNTDSYTLDQLSDWSLVVAVNDEAVLRSTLLASPEIDSRCQLICKSGFNSAGSAYNSGLSEASSEVVVFAHQDVYLPKGWKASLSRALQTLPRSDPSWGVLGVFGVKHSTSEMRGHCYSTGLKRVLGEPFGSPIQASVLDELLLVIRRSSGLRFDDSLPSFHLYGADICLQAQMAGMKSYIIPAFCIHNSNGVRYLSLDYWQSYLYMRRKWWNILPLKTCCSTIAKSYRPVVAQVASDVRHWLSSKKVVGTRCENVTALYDSLIAAREQGRANVSLEAQHV